VGRAASNDVVISHSQVSKLHARLKLDGDNATLQDASSSNGTFVNASKVKGDAEVQLRHGDTIGLGAVVITFFLRPALFDLLAARPKLPAG